MYKGCAIQVFNSKLFMFFGIYTLGTYFVYYRLFIIFLFYLFICICLICYMQRNLLKSLLYIKYSQ